MLLGAFPKLEHLVVDFGTALVSPIFFSEQFEGLGAELLKAMKQLRGLEVSGAV
jgi:hypothetical protein